MRLSTVLPWLFVAPGLVMVLSYAAFGFTGRAWFGSRARGCLAWLCLLVAAAVIANLKFLRNRRRISSAPDSTKLPAAPADKSLPPSS
jgi:hypothetical protein